MEDDFYRQVLDWTANNEILVGLDNSLYAWSPETNTISVLFCCSDKNEKISAIRACLKGEFVYFGTTEGNLFAVHIRSKEPVVIAGGFGKISCLDTSGNLLAIGCQKKNLVLLDIKSGKQTLIFQHFDISPKESCGVKFCHQGMYLAAGSNDNRFLVVQLSTMQLVVNCLEHKSAIRAIAWSRANSNLVASGGGLADKSIIFWNVKTGKIERKIQTDSQVCGLEFSKCSNELLSTHGFSKNNIQVWELDGNEKIAELLGHSNRVLYHALNPDGSTLVTSSADQTLRFWEVFPKQAEPRSHKSLFQNLMILR